MLCIAALLFVINWRYYIHATPYESVITNCIPVYKNAFQTWYQHRKNMRRIEREYTTPPAVNSLDMPQNSRVENIEDFIRLNQRPPQFLDFAKTVYNGKFSDWIVNDVKLLQNALITFVLVFPYWLIFSQVR